MRIIYQRQFERDVEKSKSRGKDKAKLKVIIKLLIEKQALPIKNCNHKLKGGIKIIGNATSNLTGYLYIKNSQ